MAGTFSADIEAFAAAAGTSLDETVRAITIELFTAVIADTPVGDPSLWKDEAAAAYAVANGYVGGRARGNWQCTQGAPAGGVIDRKDGAEQDVTRSAGGAGTVTYLTNNLPYIMRLEEGHSTQRPPHAMVRANFERVQSIVESEARRHRV